MEMKINFNKLFNLEQSSSHTPSTTSLQNSYQLQEPSMISTPSNHINLHYKFNEALFFDSELHQQNDHNMNILEDLSSIGRSFDQSFQKQKNQKLSKKKAKNDNLYKDEHDHSDIMRKEFNFNQKILKTPGERLYYEGRIQNERKQKQIDRIRHQIEIQNSKEITFKPALNEKSKKILEQAESPLRKLNNLKKSQKQKLSQKQIKPYSKRKQQEQLKNCTFHPTLIKDSKNSYLPSSINDQRNPKKVFEQLYNEHKAKQLRRKQALKQQLEKKGKKMTLQQFEDFFQRNEEYLQQKQHREEIMRAVSSQYDLTSGRKLFEPKLHNPSSSTLFNSASGTKLINTPPSKRGYEYNDQSEKKSSPSIKKNTGSKNKRSGKSRDSKSKSSSKKNLNQTKSFKAIVQKKSQKIISENKKQPKVNTNTKQPSKNQTGKQFKPNPYQVTKIGNDYLPQPVNSPKQQIQNKPKSNIFAKIRPTESLLEQRQQYEHQSDEDNLVEYKQQEINEYNDTSEIKNGEDTQRNAQIDQEYQENGQDHQQALQQQDQQDKRINIDQLSVHYKPSESEQPEGSGQNQGDNSNPFQLYENQFAQSNHQGIPGQNKYNTEEHKQQLIQQHYTQQISYEQQKDDQIQSIQNKSHYNIQIQHSDNQKIINQVENNRKELCQNDQSIPSQIKSHNTNEQIQQQEDISYKDQGPKDQQSKQDIETLKNSVEEIIIQKKQKSSFKEYIANNPKYCHKYKNLFEIENQDRGRPTQDQTPDQPVDNNSTNSKDFDAESILPLSYQKRENKIFLSKDSQQDVDETEPTVNQWQMYYKRTSNKPLLTTNQPRSTIENSSDNNKHEKTQSPINSQPQQQSPKKKPINIASMLKGKKKPTQKAQN